jgi:hypothetical protein
VTREEAETLEPGTVITWLDETSRGRRIGRFVRLEKHRDPKPGKVRKPDKVHWAVEGETYRETGSIVIGEVSVYRRRYYPDQTPEEVAEA